MTELTHRQYKILSAILQANTHITSNILLSSLSITRRTLINDIKSINANAQLILSDNRGYFINKEKQNEAEDLLMGYQNIKENNNEILKYLLTSRTKIRQDKLIERFYISESSLQKYISDINETLKDYSLQIVRQHNCYMIEGKEANKRMLLAKMIHQETESFFDDMNNFSSYFPNIEVEEVTEKVIEIVEKENYYVPKYYELNFLINILVILSRNPFIKEMPDTPSKRNRELERFPEIRIAHAIIDMMASSYMIQFINPTHVIQELDMCLYGFIQPKGNRYETPVAHFLSDSFVNKIRKLLKEVFDYYYLTSIDYESFLNVFCIHVNELIRRCSYSQNFTPTNVSLKHTSPYIYEIAVSIASKISNIFNIQIPASEINLIAIHIGYAIEQAVSDAAIAPIVIIAENYRNIGSTIAQKLTTMLKEKVQIMGFYHRISDVPYRNFKDYFVISTVQFTEKHSKICYISPFCTDADMQKISEGIHVYLEKRSREEFSHMFDRYISDDCFFSVNEKMDKYQAIRYLVDHAYGHGDVNENFYEQVLERERSSSTSFYGKFAIPHSNIQNANTTKLYIMVNHEGVIWNHEKIHLIFLILINHEAARDFRKLYEGITEALYRSNTIFENIDKIQNMNDLKRYLLI